MQSFCKVRRIKDTLRGGQGWCLSTETTWVALHNKGLSRIILGNGRGTGYKQHGQRLHTCLARHPERCQLQTAYHKADRQICVCPLVVIITAFFRARCWTCLWCPLRKKQGPSDLIPHLSIIYEQQRLKRKSEKNDDEEKWTYQPPWENVKERNYAACCVCGYHT